LKKVDHVTISLLLGVVWPSYKLHTLPGRDVHGGVHPGAGWQVGVCWDTRPCSGACACSNLTSRP